MHIICHRLNTLKQLRASPTHYGVEVDIRSMGDELILQHDPFVEGESFLEWLSAYQHGTLILNVKEEGLEAKLIAAMEAHGIDDYFFLDQSFPFLVKWANHGFRRCATRVSEFESVETVMTLAGKINWVWVDCFTHFPLSGDDAKRLTDAGFKLCLVSPELQSRDAEKEIPKLRALLKARHISPEAVCTKRPDLWQAPIVL